MSEFMAMDIRVIVFSMMAVLAGLFIGAKFFVPRERDRTRKEAQFAEAALSFKASPSKEAFDLCLSAAKDLPHLAGKADDEIKKYLNQQGIIFS